MTEVRGGGRASVSTHLQRPEGGYGLVSTRVPEAKPSKKPPRGCWGGMPKILFNRYYCSTIRRCHNKTAYSYQMLFFPHVFNLLKL